MSPSWLGRIGCFCAVPPGSWGGTAFLQMALAERYDRNWILGTSKEAPKPTSAESV